MREEIGREENVEDVEKKSEWGVSDYCREERIMWRLKEMDKM